MTVLVLIVGALIVTASALLVLGAFIPRVPYLGAIGSLVWPTLIGPATIFVLVGLVLSLVAFGMSGSRVALAFSCLGVLASIGSLVIFGSQLVAAVRVGVPIRPSVLLATGVGPRVPVDESVDYATDPDGNPLRMDIHRPRTGDMDVAAPIIVYVHGGGWFQGAPDENTAMLRWFADQGYLVVAPGYTLATDERPTWDIATPQIATALAWIAAHARDLGADPDRIAAWGASAGANLTLITAYAAAAGQLAGVTPGDLPRVAAVAGEVPAVDPAWISSNTDPIWGDRTREMVERYIGGTIEDHPDRLAAIRVATYLSPKAPPTLLTVSAGDHLVPVEGTRRFVDEARAAGVDIQAFYRPWGEHVIAAIHDGLSGQTMLRQMLDHFRRHGV